MDMLKRFFPLSFKAKDLNALIVALIVYVVVDVLCGAVIGLLAKIPLIGLVFGILGTVIGLYAFIGIVLVLLVFFKVIKD